MDNPINQNSQPVQVNQPDIQTTQVAQIGKSKKTLWYVVSALLIIIIGAASYLYFKNNRNIEIRDRDPLVQNSAEGARSTQDLTKNNMDLKTQFETYLNDQIKEAAAKDPNVQQSIKEGSIKCDGQDCQATIVIKQDKTTWTMPVYFQYENNTWTNVTKEKTLESLKASEEAKPTRKTENIYNLSVYVGSGIGAKVLANGVEQAYFTSEPSKDQTTVNGQIYLNPGKNKIEIVYTSNKNTETDFTYSYELRGYPQSVSSSDAMFDDSYIVKTTASKDNFTGFMKDKINGTKTITLNVDAK